MTDTTIKPINFMDPDASLINEFCRIAGEGSIDEATNGAADFAVAHMGSAREISLVDTRELARKAAKAAITNSDDDVLEDLDAQMQRTPAEISEAMEQAYHRAWASRAVADPHPISTGPWAELMLRYPDLHEPIHHGEYASGYYSGILAALRWVIGGGWLADT